MKNINIDIRFEGDKFSPKKLKSLTGLPIETLAEYGEIANKGRYRGKLYPYGIALLKVDKQPNKDVNYILDKYLNKLLDKKKELYQSGVEDIVIDVETLPHKESGLSFENDLLLKISKLNARIDVHTINGNEYEPSISELRSYIISNFNDEIMRDESKRLKIKNELKAKHLLIASTALHSKQSSDFAMGLLLLYLVKYWNTEDKQIPSFEEAIRKLYY